MYTLRVVSISVPVPEVHRRSSSIHTEYSRPDLNPLVIVSMPSARGSEASRVTPDRQPLCTHLQPPVNTVPASIHVVSFPTASRHMSPLPHPWIREGGSQPYQSIWTHSQTSIEQGRTKVISGGEILLHSTIMLCSNPKSPLPSGIEWMDIRSIAGRQLGVCMRLCGNPAPRLRQPKP